MPSAIRERIDDADVVIDATGNEALLGSLAMVAEEMDKPLVSGSTLSRRFHWPGATAGVAG